MINESPDLRVSVCEQKLHAGRIEIGTFTPDRARYFAHDEGFVVSLTYATVPEEYSNPGSSQPGQTLSLIHI